MFKYIIYYSSIINHLILASHESNLDIFTRILGSRYSFDRIDHQTIASLSWDNLLVASIIKVSTRTCPSVDYFIISIDLINSSIITVIIHKKPKEHTYLNN